MPDFAEQFRIFRKEFNITQAEMAVVIGVSEPTIGNWELGKAIPRHKVLQKISQVSGKPISWFTGNQADDKHAMLVGSKVEGRLRPPSLERLPEIERVSEGTASYQARSDTGRRWTPERPAQPERTPYDSGRFHVRSVRAHVNGMRGILNAALSEALHECLEVGVDVDELEAALHAAQEREANLQSLLLESKKREAELLRRESDLLQVICYSKRYSEDEWMKKFGDEWYHDDHDDWFGQAAWRLGLDPNDKRNDIAINWLAQELHSQHEADEVSAWQCMQEEIKRGK